MSMSRFSDRMAFNGDSSAKRQRVDYEQAKPSGETEFFSGGEPRRKSRPAPENHILLLTVFQPAYPITTEVLHTICHPHGKVYRIVIFKKNGVQAMVEFDSIESAKRAKEALDGADIYAGCCTLKVEFAKPTKLNVYKNDMDSWDYTAPPSGVLSKTTPARGPLLQEPVHYGARPTPYRGGSGVPPQSAQSFHPPETVEYNDGYNDYETFEHSRCVERVEYDDISNEYSLYKRPGPPAPRSFGTPGRELPIAPGRGDILGSRGGGDILRAPAAPGQRSILGSRAPPIGSNSILSAPNGAPSQSAVVMVYGLDPQKVNCDKLFNLFCLYGNVGKIKFLKSKEGCAMIQMSDAVAVERCIGNLNNVNLHCGEMQLGHSKQIYLSDVQYPFNLPDETPSFKSYINSNNNRFLNPQMAAKNRITPPSKILHFFNTPVNMTDEKIIGVFEEKDVKPPIKAAMIPPKGDRSSSGLVEFASIPNAVEALMSCNHMPIKSDGSNFPFTMKLCFSSSRSINVNKTNFNKSE